MGHAETPIQRACIALLEQLGWLVIRLNAGSARRRGHYVQLAPKGMPDLLGLGPGGRCLFVEVKRPGEEPTADQLVRHAELRSLGFAVVVADSPAGLASALEQLGVCYVGG